MKSDMERVPEGYIGLEIYGAYIKDCDFVLIGEPDENSDHNCDAMGCGTLDHVLIRCKIPEWQAAQLIPDAEPAESDDEHPEWNTYIRYQARARGQ